jgi:hypothetical protein
VSTAKKSRGGHHLLLWIGLGMITAAIVLVLGLSLYAARVASNLNPQAGSQGEPAAPEQNGQPSNNQGQKQPSNQGSQTPRQGEVAQRDSANLDAARTSFEQAVKGYGNPNLEVSEVMEFANNYYTEVKEKNTGIGAMELLISRPGSRVYQEPGPNMMWNTKYGMMSGNGARRGMMGLSGRGMMGPNGQGMMGSSSASASAQNPRSNTADKMAVNPEQARKIADAYLSRVSPGTTAEEPTRFYGYYTIDTEKDGRTSGMLSVNGYSGEVWYHSWHGPFVAKEEGE